MILMKNKDVNLVVNFLMDLKLKGTESRMRTRLVKILQEHHQNIVYAEYIEMVQELATKDEDGNPISTVEEVNGQTLERYEYSDENRAKLKEESEKLMNEDYQIDETTNTAPMIESVRKSISEYDEVLSGADAMRYDEICEIFGL